MNIKSFVKVPQFGEISSKVINHYLHFNVIMFFVLVM
jgi:hypothetical protein